jgi:hypothetical protein
MARGLTLSIEASYSSREALIALVSALRTTAADTDAIWKAWI